MTDQTNPTELPYPAEDHAALLDLFRFPAPTPGSRADISRDPAAFAASWDYADYPRTFTAREDLRAVGLLS